MKLPEKWSEQTGLENIRTILDTGSPVHDSMGDLLNLKLVDFGDGACVYEGIPDERHINPRGHIHGGWAMSILDAAAVLAVVTALPKGRLCATSSIDVKFSRPIIAGMKCRAEGQLKSMGTNLAHSEAKLTDVETGKLLAFCICSSSMYDAKD